MAARRQISNGARLWREPYLPGLLLFEFLVLLPTGLYLFISQPAWSMLYLMDSAEVSNWVMLGIMASSLFAATLAYLVGYFLSARRKNGVLNILFLLVCVGGFVFFLLAGGRLEHLAEQGDWQEAPGLLASRLGIMFAFIVPVVFGGWIFLVVLFAMEGRKMLRARIGTIRADSNRGFRISSHGSLISASAPVASRPAASEPGQAASDPGPASAD